MSAADPSQSTSALLGGLMNDVSDLVRNEVDLARAEVADSAKSAAVALGMILVATVIAFVALNVLTGAIVAAMVNYGMNNATAALIVGAVYAVVAAVVVAMAIRKLRNIKLVPTRTAHSLKRDAATVRGAAS